MSQLPDLPDATTAADGDKLLKRDTSTGTDEGLTVSLLRDEIAGKTAGDLAQYEDDGSGNAVLDFPDKAAQRETLGVSNIGFRNKLLNPTGEINQEGYAEGSTMSLADAEYFRDQWRSFGATSGIQVDADGTFHLGAGEGCEQPIEASLFMQAGDTFTFSVVDPSADLTITLLSYDETTGSTSGTISAGTGRQGVTLTIPTLDADGHVIARIEDASGGGVTFRLPQFEAGSQATEFDERHIVTESNLCLRYFERIMPGTQQVSVATGVFYDQTNAEIMIHYIEKRAAPSFSVSANSDWRVLGDSGKNDISLSLRASGPKYCSVDATLNSGSSIDGGAATLQEYNSGSGYLDFGARL